MWQYHTYTYDPLGKRKTFFSDETTTRFYWDGDNIVREKGPGTTTYYRGKDSIIAQIKDGTKNYYVYDGHGDTIALLDSNGFLTVEEKTYTAFGNAMEKSLYVPFRYNGQYYDSYSGLYYLRNRYYDPELGRFLTEDPYWNANNMIHGDKQYGEGEAKIPDYSAIAQSANLYVYCMNDPVNLSDMLGTVAGEHFSTPDEAAIDWAWNYYGITEYSNMEHASLLYIAQDEYGEYYYSYTVANDFSPMSSDPYSLEHHVWEARGIVVGSIHSHPFTNYPSEADKQLSESKGHYVYVVGKSYYSDGVDICKQYNFGDGSRTYAVASDMSYRRLTYGEQLAADARFDWKWLKYNYEIELGYQYKWRERGYI